MGNLPSIPNVDYRNIIIAFMHAFVKFIRVKIVVFYYLFIYSFAGKTSLFWVCCCYCSGGDSTFGFDVTLFACLLVCVVCLFT
jgi:hypothetical protein